jgi:hypothetical protein
MRAVLMIAIFDEELGKGFVGVNRCEPRSDQS